MAWTKIINRFRWIVYWPILPQPRKLPSFLLIFAGVSVGVWLIDTLTKLGVEHFVPTLVSRNSGISFGLLPTFAWNIVLLLGTLGLIGYVLCTRNRVTLVPWGLVVGGAVSNLRDRWSGGVVDWLTVPGVGWKNNLADWAICLGLLWIFLIQYHREKHLSHSV